MPPKVHLFVFSPSSFALCSICRKEAIGPIHRATGAALISVACRPIVLLLRLPKRLRWLAAGLNTKKRAALTPATPPRSLFSLVANPSPCPGAHVLESSSTPMTLGIRPCARCCRYARNRDFASDGKVTLDLPFLILKGTHTRGYQIPPRVYRKIGPRGPQGAGGSDRLRGARANCGPPAAREKGGPREGKRRSCKRESGRSRWTRRRRPDEGRRRALADRRRGGGRNILQAVQNAAGLPASLY